MKINKTLYQGVTTLEVLEGADNYNRWIADTIREYTKSPFVELGAGIGNISEYFSHLKSFTVTEVDEGLLHILKSRYGKNKNISVERLDITKKSLHFSEKFSTAFAVNVFEHIKDDGEAMKNVAGLLKKDGRLVLLVPAKKIAYTRLDKSLGHFRRYEKRELKDKLEHAGYTVEKLYFFNMIGLISWIIREKIEKQNRQLDKSQIALFDRVVPLLRFIESFIPVPVGISLIAVARKK